MGTSVNQSSPPTPAWRAVVAAYTTPSVPAKRVLSLLVRAASKDPGTNLFTRLESPVVARCLQIALQHDNPRAAGAAVNREIVESKAAGLETVLARRAVMQSYQAPARAAEYARALFSGACEYLASRDLPGLVGNTDRLRTVTDLRVFKVKLVREVERAVDRAGPPPTVLTPQTWSEYAKSIVQELMK